MEGGEVSVSAIDERIVSMKFQNSSFMNGIKGTLDALAKLKAGLNLDGATKGIQELDEAGKRFSLAGMASGVEGISGKFIALSTVAITALTNIVNKAIDAGSRIMKSLTVDPIKAGLQEYETNLNSIQTILANTQASGSTLQDVNGALKELNAYSDQTIYNFSEMARNIGTFTAAGVNLETSTASIKGIANLAALSGSNSQQASTAMYQLSQAISSGKVSLMDWNSVVNAGMGGSVFQRALAETAVKMGKLSESSLTLEGDMKNVKIAGESFRDSISAEGGGESWLTSDVLTTTLSQFTGDLTDAELAAQGFTAEQIKAIQATAATAKSAATEVKTVSQLMGTLQESAGSGWAQTWELIFGDFEEAKKLWTGVNNVLSGMIGASADARNAVIGDWKALGGRTALIDAFKNGWTALMSIINPVKEALREIFPPATGAQLMQITENIKMFAASLVLSEPAAANLKRTFRGVFALLDIGLMIIKGAASMFLDLFGTLTEGSGGILEFTGNLGDFVVKLRDSIKNGEGLKTFFDGLKNVLAVPIALIRALAGFIGDLFGAKVDGGPVEAGLDRMKQRLEPLGAIGEAISKIFGGLGDKFKAVWEFFKPMAQQLSDFFGSLGKTIGDTVSNMDYTAMLDTINTGLFAGLVLMFKKFLSGGSSINIGEGLFGSIKDTLGGVTDTLSAMQAQLKASALLKIAGAIVLLAAGLAVLALIDPVKLGTALGAVTIMFGQLIGALAAFNAVTTTFGALKLTMVGASLILLATAMVILAVAVKMLADLSWEELAKGLAGVVVLLAALSGAMKLMSGNSAGMVRAGAGLILVAIAIKILASAVEDFAGMSWEEMVKGLIGVSAALGALALFTKLAETGKGAIAQGAGLILLALALKLIASAVGDFADMDWETLGRGFAGMGAALLIIAGAMHLMPKNMLVTAVALVVVAASLKLMASVLGDFAGMSWEEIAKGLVMLAGSLVIIAGALYLMSAALPGAAALIIAAGALAILAPVLTTLGAMSWEEIGMGLAALAGVFLVLGVAGLVLAPVVPIIIGLGIAVALIGVGLAAAGLGVLAFSAALLGLSVAAAAGGLAITVLVSAIIGLIPAAMVALANGIIGFVMVITNAAPVFLVAMTTLILTLLQAINIIAPQIVNTLIKLIFLLVNNLVMAIPKFVDAGLRLVTGILTGIGNNIGKIVAAGANIIINFINGIAKALPGIAQAAANLIVTFVNSIANAIRSNQSAMDRAGQNLASAIVSGMASGIRNGVSTVINAAKTLATSALSAAKKALGIASPSKEFFKVGGFSTQGMANGLVKTAGIVVSAARGVGTSALTALRDTMSGVGDAGLMDLDFSPTIRPVLDLSNIEKGSNLIDGLLTPSTINPEASYGAAASIAADNRASEQTMDEDTINAQREREVTVNYNQYISSPKAVPNAEIYRNSKNQISVLKGALPK